MPGNPSTEENREKRIEGRNYELLLLSGGLPRFYILGPVGRK
jgi:hypothetical protein